MEHCHLDSDGDIFALPFKITLAIAAACDPTRITMRPQERSLLCFLLQRVSATNPATPFRCRVDRLALQFDVSTRSIHNWFAALREIGLVTFHQRRNHYGSFGLAVVLTKNAIESLCLHKAPLKQFTHYVKPQRPSAAPQVPREASAHPPLQQAALEDAVAAHDRLAEVRSVKNISDTDRPENNLINNQPGTGNSQKNSFGKIPSDLIELVIEHKLSTPTVFWLMKQASTKSNRLSDIYQVASRYLAGLEPRKVKAYLLKCIGSGTDYASVINSKCSALTEKALHANKLQAAKVLRQAIDHAGGALPLRSNFWLFHEMGTLFKGVKLDSGRMDSKGAIVGDTADMLARRWQEHGNLIAG
jgi:hypothetical protein